VRLAVQHPRVRCASPLLVAGWSESLRLLLMPADMEQQPEPTAEADRQPQEPASQEKPEQPEPHAAETKEQPQEPASQHEVETPRKSPSTKEKRQDGSSAAAGVQPPREEQLSVEGTGPEEQFSMEDSYTIEGSAEIQGESRGTEATFETEEDSTSPNPPAATEPSARSGAGLEPGKAEGLPELATAPTVADPGRSLTSGEEAAEARIAADAEPQEASKPEAAEEASKPEAAEGAPPLRAPEASSEPAARLEPGSTASSSAATPAAPQDSGGTSASHAASASAPPRPRRRPASSPEQGSTQYRSRSSLHGLGSVKDLRQKTAFSTCTQDGVLKRATYMNSISSFRSCPKWSMGSRTGTSFLRSNSTPAPDTYSKCSHDNEKYKSTPKYSFGGGSRFNIEASQARRQPGPGVYNPRDPVAELIPKVGFGSQMRFKGGIIAQANPGPGAYETCGRLGQGAKMYTATGRHSAALHRGRSLPGPGAYDPSAHSVYEAAPKCGFGTSTRSDGSEARRSLASPGPGAYELQNFRATGTEAPQFSAVSRRQIHDLNTYLTPGPGSYNSHITSFGY
jgi:hypothetical protein